MADKKLMECIGAAARVARAQLKLTQEDAAERIGVSAEFYARIERGNALPSVPTLARICTSLGVSADVLLGLSSDGSDDKDVLVPTWESPLAADDPPEIRRIIRRLRKATPGTRRLVTIIMKELDRE